jgi:hypothetical protein
MDAQAALLGYEGSRVTEAGGTGGEQAAGLGSHLAEVARAIRGHTAMLAPGSPDPAAGPPATDADLRAGLARATSPLAGPPPGPAAATIAGQREELVLSALLQQHAQAAQILGFLPAAAFTSPARQEIFRAVHRLVLAGRPVDELTVGWDLAARAATTAVVSAGTGWLPAVPGGYLDRLARTATDGDRSPLRVARDLSALLEHRSPGRRPAPARRQGEPAPAQAPSPPLNRPPRDATARRHGPEQRR